MIFADQQLARRIERAERDTTECYGLACRRGDPRVAILPLAGGLAVYAGPENPISKVIGVGFDGLPAADELAAVERTFWQAGARVSFEVSTLADPRVAALLTARGYRLVNFENVSGRAPSPALDLVRPAELAIEEVTAESHAVWCQTMAHAFAAPDLTGVMAHEEFSADVLEALMHSLGEAPGGRRFLARWEGQPAGGASLRICGGLAQLSGAAVLPAFRRRGIQSALCDHRLRLAREASCDLVLVTTQPGSPSQKNVMGQGFQLLYSRSVLVKEASA